MKTDSNSMIELRNRREFLRDMAILGGAAALAGRYLPSTAFAANASNRQWRNQIGLELFTIRSLMNTPEAYEKALADISEIGIREIEPAGGYAGMEPAPFRAMLDKYNLSMPSTHSGASEGPDLEKTLEGFQIMGMKYTEISSGGGGGRGGRGGRGGAAIPGASPEQQAAVDELTAATADANQAATDARNALIAASLAVPRNVAEIQTRSAALAAAETRLAEARAEALARIQGSPNRLNEEQLASLLQQNGGPAPAGGRGGRGGGSAPQTVESVKRAAEVNNEHGRMAQKFGMKILIHNHTGEFERLAGSDLRQHDVMVAETDPELVTMQLDIGWSSVAGADAIELFRSNPGRYELWHVKDATGLKAMPPGLTPSERQPMATLCPVGEGDIDYKTIFNYADIAGMKHFCVEQDNARGMEDVVTSYQNLLLKVLV